MRTTSRPVSTARVAAASDDKARRTRQTILALAAASALALSAISLARAETWVTVNPDGSVTRTESAAMPARSTPGQNSAVYPPASVGTTTQPNVQIGTANTTFYAGTYYPVPNVYTYQIPGGVTYPIGQQFPRFHSPTITTLPSTGVAYGYPGYGYAPYGQQVFGQTYYGQPYGQPVYGQPGCYPAPVYAQPYPLYGQSGVYYSGPAGGGGTIYSSTTTNNRGYGVGFGNGGLNISIGNGGRTTTSSTTITTYGAR